MIRIRQKQLKTNTVHAREAKIMQTTAEMEALENEEHMYNVLMRMPKNKRPLLALFYLSELDVSQTSERIKIREGTVKSSLYTAQPTFKCLSEKTRFTKFSPVIKSVKKTVQKEQT